MKGLGSFTSFWELGLAVTSMALIFIIPLAVNNADAFSSKPRVGGPCTYKQYEGEAQIISVKPSSTVSGDYEIRFSFLSKENVQETFANPEGRQWSIVRKDFSSPQKDFVQKHSIETGKRLPCIMKVITRGTCTPVLFDFPTINEARGQ